MKGVHTVSLNGEKNHRCWGWQIDADHFILPVRIYGPIETNPGSESSICSHFQHPQRIHDIQISNEMFFIFWRPLSHKLVKYLVSDMLGTHWKNSIINHISWFEKRISTVILSPLTQISLCVLVLYVWMSYNYIAHCLAPNQVINFNPIWMKATLVIFRIRN